MPVRWELDDVLISPAGPVDAVLRPPGSKSLTQRYLVCAALADGTSRLRGALLADDSRRLTDGLRRLGFHIDLIADDDTIVVHGRGGVIPSDEAELDAGAAGTAMRFLTALVCLGHGIFRIDGSPRMRQRPIGPLVDALTQLGARIGYDGTTGFPPLTIAAHGLAGGEVEFSNPPSSQFVSALLMVAPYALRDVFLRIRGGLVSRPYVALTLQVMRELRVEALAGEHGSFIVPGSQRYHAGDFDVEPDASSASYLLAAAAVTGGRVRIPGLTRGSAQGDARFASVLERMGCTVADTPAGLELRGPAGRLRAVDEDMNDVPDTVQTLAAAALFADAPTVIRNVANLRIKETDRLAALATELTRLGARIEARPDGLTIHPPATISPAAIDTYDDHRMAMAFAVVGLAAPGIRIRNAACVSKSYPAFFDALAALHSRAR